MERRKIPAVYAIGTEDPFYDQALIERLEGLEHVRLVCIGGAGHLLEDTASERPSIEKSIDNIKTLILSVADALKEGFGT